MPRLARMKQIGGGGYYHLCSRTGGVKGEFPLNDGLCRRRLVDLFRLFSRVYCCKIIGFCIMGNHYHLIVQFDEQRAMTRRELRKRAALIYSKSVLDGWLKDKWERFEARIFNVSELMRNLQASFARWYNQKNQRRGRFWANRFKSTLLEDRQQVIDCLLYVDLNPVRAGLVKRPEQWEGSSIFYRELGKDRWLAPLGDILGIKKHSQALTQYKSRLYYRGAVPTKPGQAAILNKIIKEEEARGFKKSGAYRKKLRFFVDGIALGSEEYIKSHIKIMRETGNYKRRKNPIKQEGGHMTLREQRSTALEF